MKCEKITLFCYTVLIFIVGLLITLMIYANKRFYVNSIEPEMPSQVVVYDRSNKKVVFYDAVPKIRGDVLYVQDAIVTETRDVSDLIE